MHGKSVVAGAAFAMAATIGSASAADPFATVEGDEAQGLTPQEMGLERGAMAPQGTRPNRGPVRAGEVIGGIEGAPAGGATDAGVGLLAPVTLGFPPPAARFSTQPD